MVHEFDFKKTDKQQNIPVTAYSPANNIAVTKINKVGSSSLDKKSKPRNNLSKMELLGSMN